MIIIIIIKLIIAVIIIIVTIRIIWKKILKLNYNIIKLKLGYLKFIKYSNKKFK
jgi:hypothetical protein